MQLHIFGNIIYALSTIELFHIDILSIYTYSVHFNISNKYITICSLVLRNDIEEYLVRSS